MPKPTVDLTVIGIGSPLKIGVYKDLSLIESLVSEEKTSTALPLQFQDLLSRYSPQTIYFARGPGSFMAIKLTYIFLKSLEISHGVRLKATEGFAFNQSRPIKAVGQRYFVLQNGEIILQTLPKEERVIHPFELPTRLNPDQFHDKIQPLYILPAV